MSPILPRPSDNLSMSQDHGREFAAAIRAGDWDRSDRLLGGLETPLPDHLLSSIAELHLVRERWAEVIDALSRMKYRDKKAEMRLKLARNLAALQIHRPRVYRALMSAAPGIQYSLGTSRTGHPTVVYKNELGGQTSLSADNDPLGGVQRAMKSIEPAYKIGKAIGVTSIGDGYLFDHFAKNPPPLILGREHVITLIESEPNLLMACLMIHDYTGPDGPIQQERFDWYVGADWVADLREDFLGDLFRIYPTVILRSGLRKRRRSKRIWKAFSKKIARRLDDQLVAHVDGRILRP